MNAKLGNFIKVENMESSRGNTITNQFYIRTDKGEVFQSYGSVIAFIPNTLREKTLLDRRYWDYSTTTGKYRNQFLEEDKKTTQKKIDSGEYLLDDLN